MPGPRRLLPLLLLAFACPAAAFPPGDDDGDRYEEPDDCNDRDRHVYPGATERANGIDDDCDGIIDEGTALYDDDGDGFTEEQEDGRDCDDTDPDRHPGAPERCNGLDDDCDGTSETLESCDTGGPDTAAEPDPDDDEDGNKHEDPPAGGCSSSGAAPTFAWGAAALGAVLRPRRRL